MSETPPPELGLQSPNMQPFLVALDFAGVPDILRSDIEKFISDPSSAKAGIHGALHHAHMTGLITEMHAAFLLQALNNSTDLQDIEFNSFFVTSQPRNLTLAEAVGEFADECLDVCFGDLPQDKRDELKSGSKIIWKAIEIEEADEEKLLQQLIEKGTSVVEANKQYPNKPFLMAHLARARGNAGFEELLEVYPPLPGSPDSQMVALWLIKGFRDMEKE